MAKYLSNRQKNLKVGISSYTENRTVLEVTGGAYISGNTGIGTTNPTSKLTVTGDVLVSGVVTATNFIGNLTGTATTATNLANAANITTGTISSSRLSGTYGIDVTGTATTATNLADAANITTGFINKDRLLNSNSFSVLGDLYVSNNISFGGTTTQLNLQQLEIVDADIVLGIGTSFSPTDNTANHGGIAIASTEGTPLVNLNIVPGEINPPTYKKIMWFKGDTIGAGLTDAWLFNYAVGIGITHVPNGVRLAAGGMQVTDSTVTTPQLNVTGLSTLTALSVSGSTGTYGQYLKSTITGLVWSSFTPLRSTYSYSATENQKEFSAVGINSGYVDVFLNGIRLDDTNYSIVGTGISLGVGAFDNDEITIVGFSTTTASNSDTAGYSAWDKYYTGVSTSSSVGIGTTVPTEKLQVQGNVRITGGIYDSNNNVGASGSILVSTGAGISWTTPNSISNLAFITGTTSTYTATTIVDYIGVSATVPVTITLPSSPPPGKQIVVKDEGNNIATYNITVTVGAGVSVENDTSVVMNINHQSLTYMFNGSNWFLI
jgi:hypothetical protein